MAEVSGKPLSEDLAAAAFVHGAQLVGPLSGPQRAKFIESSVLLDFQAGQVVIEMGAPDDTLFLVAEGKVSICVPHEDDLLEVATLDRHGVFGEAAVLMSQPQRTTAVCRGSVKIIGVKGEIVRHLAQSSPKFGKRLAALMAARSKELEQIQL